MPKNQPYRVALTGRSGVGKSTTLKYIKDNAGDKIECGPEAARILLEGGFPLIPEDQQESFRWRRAFQLGVATLQLAIEYATEALANSNDKEIIVYDRGLLDGAAYLSGGIPELSLYTGMSEEEMLSRYDKVIHLGMLSISLNDTSILNLSDEEFEKTMEWEYKHLHAWDNHPNRAFVDQSNQNYGESVLSLIETSMGS